MNTIALRISSVIKASPTRLEMNLAMFGQFAGRRGDAGPPRRSAQLMYALSR